MLSSSPKPPNSPNPKRARPRGLWRGRVNAPRCFADHVREWQEGVYTDSDTDDDEQEEATTSSSSSSSKRRRLTPEFSDSGESDERDTAFCREYRETCSPSPVDRVSSWVRRARIMDTTSTARRGDQTDAKTSCTYEDWDDLKDLFAKAAEQYENAEPAEAIPLLRAVVHDCHRFLIYYHDPSVLYSSAAQNLASAPSTSTPTEDRFRGEWASDRSTRGRNTAPPPPPVESRKPKPQEPATAFHAILGTALFLFGNLIAQDSSLALAGEPSSPCPYWLAALDVFETGENLPSRVNGRGYDMPEDWRMAIVWGRTLVCIVDDALTRTQKAKQSAPPGSSPTVTTCISTADQYSADEPHWPQDSPFSAIAARRPPITRRMTLSSSTPNDLMVLAMDQFSRGIFHMPHPQHTSAAGANPPLVPPLTDSFSRAKELFTIASEVLGVAEKFEIPSERQYWARWADSVFNQMKMEADMDAWRGSITRARGRCWLIVGSAKVESLEEALESGDAAVLQSEDAQEAREGLANAISFFERAKGSATSSSDPETQDLKPLLAEALLTLANLTSDENRREELYTRAQREVDGSLDLDREMADS